MTSTTSPPSAPLAAPAPPARVSLERRGHVLIIRMDRIAKRNAIDPDMTTALDAALNELDDDPDLRCGVLTGGTDFFSAGTDLARGAGEPTPRGGPYGIAGRNRAKPLIAAVEGIAYGGGFELVLACDMVVAGRSARFGLPEVSRGVVATCGALFRAWQPLPITVAKQMLLTGRPLPAERAHDLGMVNELTEDGQVLQAAVELAQQICSNSPVSVTATLTAVDQVAGRSDELGWSATDNALATILASEDYREGVSAFLEKRSPQWSGH